MQDGKQRTIDYLRISVTDRCNFRCVYCMPEEGIDSLSHNEVMTFEEIIRVCKSAALLGVTKIKLTGGEPLVRKNLIHLVREIKAIPEIKEITLTTNGLLLEENLEGLIVAGITHINISLDTLDEEQFKQITRVDGLEKVVRAITLAANSTLKGVKINVLMAKHFNEEQLLNLAGLAKNQNINVRFIELMPIGLGAKLEHLPKEEVFKRLEKRFGKLIPYEKKLGNGPAKYYVVPGFKGKIGFISAVSECFCMDCNRIRLTADGFLKLCLHSREGIDLKSLLRSGVNDKELIKVMQQAIYKKPEQHHFQDTSQSHFENKLMAQIGG